MRREFVADTLGGFQGIDIRQAIKYGVYFDNFQVFHKSNIYQSAYLPVLLCVSDCHYLAPIATSRRSYIITCSVAGNLESMRSCTIAALIGSRFHSRDVLSIHAKCSVVRLLPIMYLSCRAKIGGVLWSDLILVSS